MDDTPKEESIDLPPAREEKNEEVAKIHIDSSLIESATIQDEDAELGSLGLRLYDQSALESGIRLQVDAAMEKMEAKRQKANAEKRARMLRNRIAQLSQRRQRLRSAATASPRSFEELRRQRRQQAELAELAEELAQLREELEGLEAGGGSQAGGGGDQSAAALLSGGGESELEAKVRLGEVTPFGTDLSEVTTEAARSPPATAGTSAEILVDQSDFATPRPPDGSNQSALAVSRSPAGAGQSDDEYLPSDETADESDEAYALSDEDGELTDKERPRLKGAKRKRDSAGSKSVGKTAKRSRRPPDDGDPEAYAARIADWRRERRERRLRRIEQGFVDDGDEEERCVEFDGGFRCPAALWDRLFKYQQVCVRWLWELHQQRCGGILGDEMGLGKTIQIIAFLAGLSHSNVRWGGGRGLGPVLVMAPATVLHQWVAEFHRWWPPLRVAVLHESGSHAGSKSSLVRQMARGRGVLLTSYSAMTSHKDLLIAQDWHYVILDEGHKIRNPDAQITLAVKQVRTPHRVILSGSPLQNNLRELWSLFDFVFPGKLGTLPVFVAQFAVPITQGGYTNASDSQVVTAFRCAKVLRDTIAPYLLRRMKADVQQTLQLPTKNEQVLFCRLTEVQRRLYQDYINSDSLTRILRGTMKVFVGLIALRKLCNHPDLLTGSPLDAESPDEAPEAPGEAPEAPGETPGGFGYWRRSGKMVVLSALLELWKKQRHKVLLFTQSRQMLSILEAFVAARGYSYLRMDGGTSVGSRQTLIRRFNSEPEIFCFLLTTRVGGLGVNLTGANRIIIYDPDWNPSTDQQARERAWRIGQDRHVTIYRLLTAGTIEEKIYHRQIFKQFLTNRVLKDPKQQRFFKTNDLHDLFTLTEEGDGGEGGGAGGPAAAPPATTETAEIFSGSQVSAAALEARRQRERRDRRRREAAQARQAERRRRRLLLKARQLNRKLFTAPAGEGEGKGGEGRREKEKKGSGKGRKTIVDETRAGKERLREEEVDKSGAMKAANGAESAKREDIVLKEQRDTDIVLKTQRDTAAVAENEQASRREHGTVSMLLPGERGESDGRREDGERTGGRGSAEAETEEAKTSQDEGVKNQAISENSAKDSRKAEPLEEGELKEDAPSSPANPDPPEPRPTPAGPTETTSGAPAATSGAVTARTDAVASTSGASFPSQPSDPSTSPSPSKRTPSTPKHRKKLRTGEADERRRKRRKEDDPRGKRSDKRRRRRGVDPLLEEVEGLVDSEVYRPPQTEEKEAGSDRSQDDYVLTKLLKKSGVHSALRHDVIEGHGTPDGAILEAEAAQVAREAVAALKASRREVRAAELGTLTWTGQSGRAGLPSARPRFGQKKNPLLAPKPPPPPPPPPKKSAPSLPTLFAPDTARKPRPSISAAATAPEAANLFAGTAALGVGSSSTNADTAPLSSAQLLARIRRRAAGEDGAEAAQVAREHADLLADIRNFVAFQTWTNGRAKTKELVDEFKGRLPQEQTPLFKALLTEICEFERGADKVGWWVLREELR